MKTPHGRPGDPGLFPPGSVARRVNAETRLLLGGQRALLMQIAHPLVAAGVADHSGFPERAFDRLWSTLDLTLTIGFGDEERSAAARRRVERTHSAVTGARDDAPYAALDPDLLAWVHATLVDSAIVTYRRFVGRIGEGAADRYLREMHAQARAFGVPDDRLWPDLAAFRSYVGTTTDALEVTAEARELARSILDPPAPAMARPAVPLFRFVTIGLLPPSLRAAFGLMWSPKRERRLAAVAAVARTAGSVLPDPVRRWPHAREANARLHAA